MTRERAKELWPVMKGYAEGREVQSRFKNREVNHDSWVYSRSPEWHDNVEYRLKPEPREWWEVRWAREEDGYPISFLCKEEAEAFARSRSEKEGKLVEIVHVREVVD